MQLGIKCKNDEELIKMVHSLLPISKVKSKFYSEILFNTSKSSTKDYLAVIEL